MTLFNAKNHNYCGCIRCVGNKVPYRECPCKICNNCSIHMGFGHIEEESEKSGICRGCNELKTITSKCDMQGLNFLVMGIYERVYQDAIGEERVEKRNAIRWIKSESFYYYPKLLGMSLNGLQEGMLERVENKLKNEHRKFEST